jgi:hypothetical protein
MVEGQLVHADAELAAVLRLVARQLFVIQAECDRLTHELEPLWEARFSGALDRILDTVAQLHESEVGGWPGRRATPTVVVRDTDLQLLRALVAEPEPHSWRAG